MKSPAGPQPSQSSAPNASTPPSQPQKPPAPNPTGATAPRGEDFDISTLPTSPDSNGKKRLPAHWNRAWLAVAAALGAYCLWFLAYGMGAHAQKPLPIGPIVTNSAVTTTAAVAVHVAGAVAHPGVYSLGANARIADAITQAGGATADADTTNLNLAAFVQDGAQIVVPVRVVPASNTASSGATSGNIPTNSAPAPSSPLGVSPASPTTLATPTATISAAAAQKAAQIDYLRAHPVDLNQASSFELQQLPGVGPAMADEIIAYRANNGLFRSISDLDNVKGIGEKRMESLKDLVVVH